MKTRGVYAKWTENGWMEPWYCALFSKKAKIRRQAKQAVRRRVRRTAEKPMQWIYRDLYGLPNALYGDGWDCWANGEDYEWAWEDNLYLEYTYLDWKEFADNFEELCDRPNAYDFSLNGIPLEII